MTPWSLPKMYSAVPLIENVMPDSLVWRFWLSEILLELLHAWIASRTAKRYLLNATYCFVFYVTIWEISSWHPVTIYWQISWWMRMILRYHLPRQWKQVLLSTDFRWQLPWMLFLKFSHTIMENLQFLTKGKIKLHPHNLIFPPNIYIPENKLKIKNFLNAHIFYYLYAMYPSEVIFFLSIKNVKFYLRYDEMYSPMHGIGYLPSDGIIKQHSLYSFPLCTWSHCCSYKKWFYLHSIRKLEFGEKSRILKCNEI